MLRRILIENTCKKANKNHANVQRKQMSHDSAERNFIT